MKILNTLLLFLCLTCATGFAQTLQGIALANLDVTNIRIYQIQGATIFSRYDVCIDFGIGTVARSNSKNNPFKN